MKKFTAVLLAVVMVLGTVAMAAGGTTTISVVPGMNLSVNGKVVTPTNAAGEEIEVFAYKDATYLPLRYLAELLGIKIDYDADTMTAVVEGAPVKAEIPTAGDKEYEADIVIVGAGGAGLLAAYTASQGGAKVIVLEKGPNALSSNFSRCGGPAGAETVVAKEQGVTTTNKEVFDHLYSFANTTVDAKLLWECWTRAGVAIDKMVGLGIEFRNVNDDTYGVGYQARHSFASRGNDRVGPLVSAVEETGGMFLYNTPGEHIIMDNGKAVGVTATNTETGETVIVKAKAVMTCTGGFQGNQEMLHQIFGDVNVNSLGSNTPTGDGINMVLEAGGQLDRNFGVLGDEFKADNAKAGSNTANLTFWLYGGLFVDRDGDRFINEKRIADFPLAIGGEALLRQGKVYAVMDDEYYNAVATEGIISFLGDPEDWPSKSGLRNNGILNTAPEQLEAAIADGWAYKADTIAELAAYFDLENLEATVAEYNQYCADGVDPIYGKSANFLTPVAKGPFYVFEYEPAAWSTFGGVKTDSYLRAVGANGDPIPGLYCGGCEVGSYYAVPYYDGPGSCVGIAVGSGVYAGENMLKYIGAAEETQAPAGVTGTFTGASFGFGGDVTATITVVNGKITEVKMEGPNETPGIGAAALPALAENAKAQGAELDAVAGASFTSAAAKEAMAEAMKKAGVGPEALSAGTDATSADVGDVDVVIVGGGAAGMTAAIKASEQGAKVLLIEKQAFLGGASAMASTGINAGSSDLQKATETPYTAEEFFEYAKSWDYGYDRIGYRVVPVREDFAAAFAEKSGESANWIGTLGVEMKASSASHSLQLVTKENGAFGAVYTKALMQELEAHKDVKVLTETKATALVMDGGAVKGVTVEDKTGTRTIEVKAVVLTTGGYSSADSSFWQTYAPEWDGFYSASAAGSTGDGIVMADAVGAKLCGMEAVTCTTVTVGQANTSGAIAVNNSLKAGSVLLNKSGERFVNETLGTAPMMEALKAEEGQVAYLIADQAVVDASSDLQTVNARGLFTTASTLEELAAKLGLPAEAVKKTFETYAASAKAGADEFERTSFATDFTAGTTYYGVLVKSAKRIATGGIVTDGQARVIDKNDAPITGLYAAGETVAYGAHPLSAAGIFGWIAGEAAAAQVLGK